MSYSKLREIFTRYPVTRGMLSYSIIWPIGNFIEQTTLAKNENIDWKKCVRFCLWGGLFVAPTLYGWIRLSSIMFPINNLKSALAKAVIEQFSYTPFAMTSFYFGMTLLEGRTVNEAFSEVSTKVPPTYKVAVSFWPFVAFLNFGFIPERNRVIFNSCCSLVWTTFLAFVKEKERNDIKDGIFKI